MVFVADDLGAWLVGLLADAGRKRLTALVLGDEQQRALRQAATSAVLATVTELCPWDSGQAAHMAMVINEVFRAPEADTLIMHETVLEGLRAGVTTRLAVLADASLTGVGQSSAEVLGIDVGVLERRLGGHLLREVIVRGAQGGALAPLADQLNHDVTHLQGDRVEGMLAALRSEALKDGGAARPVRLLPRPGLLADREDLLAELDVRLKRDKGAGPPITVLCGLGGVGKTSAAVEYAHRHQGGLSVVWQFTAEDPTTLAAGFGDLAGLLRPGKAGDAVAVVHAVLAAADWDWLLIFDNAASYQAVRDVLPPAGRGRVLVTSQNPHWPGGWVLDVPVLGQDAAARFLQQRTGQVQMAAARAVASELDGLPLALEQAAAYMLASGRDIAAYLEVLRQRRSELLARGEPAGYDKNVSTTWALAFDELRQKAPLAVGLLRLLACYAPELVPVRLLLRSEANLEGQLPSEVAALAGDMLATDDAISALRRFSLVTPNRDGMLSVHRLVQAITIAQLPVSQQNAWRRAASSLIEAALPADPQVPAGWPTYAVLLPHAQAALPPDSPDMDRIATFLGCSGSYAAACQMFRQIIEARTRSLGGEHPETLIARDDLAHFTGEAGNAADARDRYAALLPLSERVFGREHRQTLIVRSNLARWTGLAGDAHGARDEYAALLPVLERLEGAEDLITLAIRANMADFTGKAGDAAGARDEYAALLPLFERVQGPEHPMSLTIRANVGHYAGLAGDAAGARDLNAALLPIRERVLGEEHPDTLTSRANLAYYTGKAGDAAGARDQYAALLPIRERVLGEEHPDTLTSRANLAHYIGKAGDATGARDRYAALLPIRERVSGPEHPDTLRARANLADFTGEAGDAAGARDRYAALLPICERVWGSDHPDTLSARGKLANWTSRASE